MPTPGRRTRRANTRAGRPASKTHVAAHRRLWLAAALVPLIAAGYLTWTRARPRARTSDPVDRMTAEEAYAMGLQLGKSGRHQASLPFFRHAARLAPDSWTARANFANTLYNGAQEPRVHLGKLEPATRSSVERMEMIAESFRETDAAASLAADPAERALVVYQLGQSLQTFGFAIDALAEYRKAASLDPSSRPIAAAVIGTEAQLRVGGVAP